MASNSSNCCSNLLQSKSKINTKNSLSGTILEYYKKYGQNRDLEKYLRFRRGQSSSGSSSGSIRNFECPAAAANRLGRSLDDLTSPTKPSTAKNLKNLTVDNITNEKSKSRSEESINRSTKSDEIKQTVSVEQQTKASHKKKNKKKSINFTMESNIVLNVSQPSAVSGSDGVALSDKTDSVSQTEMYQNPITQPDNLLNESKTDSSPSPVADKKDSQSQTDVQQNLVDESLEHQPNNSANSSPVSLSNKHRLEWDSLADVGYANKTHDKQTETNKLSSLEREKLNNFITDNKQLTADISKPPPTTKNRNNWKMALKKFREKYKSDCVEQSLLLDDNESQVCFTDPKIHSTPNVPSKIDVQPDSPLKMDENDKIAATVKNLVAMLEKSCQTSIVGMESKEIQVNKSVSTDRTATTSKNSSVNTINSNKSVSQSSEKNPISEDDSSFEFITPKTYEKGRQKVIDEANKENVEPIASGVQTPKKANSPDEQQTLPFRVKEAIGHLNALLESTDIDNKIKKQQIHKIVSALFNVMHSNQAKQTKSLSTSSISKNSFDKQSISGIQRISSSTSSNSTNKSKSVQVSSKQNAENGATTPIKNLLQPVTHSEMDFQHNLQLDQAKQKKVIENLLNAQRKRSNNDQKEIEMIEQEINRLAALKARLIKENVSVDLIQSRLSDKSTKSESAGQQSSSSSNQNKKLSAWHSHEKLHQTALSRTKLQTPDNKNISDYAQEKLEQFIQKYETKTTKLYEKQPEIYTQPYSSSSCNNYSDTNASQKKESSKQMKNDAYTSMSGDGTDRFLSTNSVSIPGAHSLLSHTSTHQYDSRHSVSIQTGDSLRRTEPIMVEKSELCPCNSNKCQCKCTEKRRTIRVSQVQNNKQQQTMPESIAYVLTFENQILSGRQNTGKSSTIPSTRRSSSHSGSNRALQSAVDSKLTLEQHLKHRRPDFLINAEDRRKCLQEIHSLRLKQSEQRNKLLLLTSSNTLRKYLSNAAPFVAAPNRAFQSKVFRAHTKRQYNQLPDVVKRRQLEKEKKLRQHQRIITDLFKKNLQKRVLTGKLNVSNSITLLPI